MTKTVASSAEDLEAKLRARYKKTDISMDEAETLLSHPLLKGCVSRGGNHLYMLEIPPVNSPEGAVRAAIVSESR